MTAFHSFIKSLESLTDSEKTAICKQYEIASSATSSNQIKTALYSAATVILRAGPDPLLFDRMKNLQTLPYGILDARRGIHVVRSVFANEIHLMRARKVVNKSQIQQDYLKHGLVVITDFMGAELAERIDKLTKKFPISVNKQPFNLVHLMNNDRDVRDILLTGKLREVVFECLMMPNDHDDASKQYINNTFVQRVHNKPNDGDVQKVMHIDTYYDALKFWYFPEEVRLENGPFTISPDSHIMTENRLMWMQEAYMRYYDRTIGDERAIDHAEGSLRILPNEMAELGYSIRHMSVPKDSLIVSNVFGFHGRGNATLESIRDSIHGSIRLNLPFDN